MCKNVKQFIWINHFVLAKCQRIATKVRNSDHPHFFWFVFYSLRTDFYAKGSGRFVQENPKDVTFIDIPVCLASPLLPFSADSVQL